MLSHALHAVAKVAPQHLVVVVGQDRDAVAPAIAELAGELGRTIDMAVQDQQLGTGHAVGCGLAALPEDYNGIVVVTSGDVPLLDSDTLADLIATHSAESAAATVRDHHAAGSDRLRPHPAHPGPRGHGDRRAGRRHPVAAGHQRGQRRCLRLRHRGAALGAEPAAVPQRPAGALPDRRDLDRPPGRPDRACQACRRQRAGRRGQRPGAACRAGRRAEPAHRGRPSARRGHRSSTRPPRGSTST